MEGGYGEHVLREKEGRGSNFLIFLVYASWVVTEGGRRVRRAEKYVSYSSEVIHKSMVSEK
jgi:hypothetical protein